MKKLIGLAFCFCAAFLGINQAQSTTSVALSSSSIAANLGNFGSQEAYFCHDSVCAPKRTKSNMTFGFGLNNWDFGGAAPLGVVTPNFDKSWFIDLGYQYRTRIGGAKSPLGIVYGIGFIFNKYDLDNNTAEVVDGKTVFTALDSEHNYNSKLRTSRMYIPLMFDVKLAKKLYISAGGYAGVRLGSGNTRIAYERPGKDFENVDRKELNINRFNYGLMASVGKKNLRAYGRYDLSEQFNSNGPQGINPWSVGLVFNL